jgi:hypothetical protein
MRILTLRDIVDLRENINDLTIGLETAALKQTRRK